MGEDIVCLYHADCFDGMGAAWAVYKRFPKGKYIAVDYKDGLPEGLEGKHVIIVDFSFDQEEMDYIAMNAAKLTFLDHHERSEAIAQMLREMSSVVDTEIFAEYDANRSGALMAWEHFHPGQPVPQIIQHISDRDLWRFTLPDTKVIMSGLGMYLLDLQVWDELFTSFEMETELGQQMLIEHLRLAGPFVDRAKSTDVVRIIGQTLRTIELDGHTVPLINVPRSLASEALAKLAQDQPFAAGYYDEPEHRIFSLRSRKDGGVIVNRIARLFGGDGHPHAAGFRVPRDHALAKY